MFNVGDRVRKIKAAEEFEDTIGDLAIIVKSVSQNTWEAKILEGSERFLNRPYFISQPNNWELIPVTLENK